MEDINNIVSNLSLEKKQKVKCEVALNVLKTALKDEWVSELKNALNNTQVGGAVSEEESGGETSGETTVNEEADTSNNNTTETTVNEEADTSNNNTTETTTETTTDAENDTVETDSETQSGGKKKGSRKKRNLPLRARTLKKQKGGSKKRFDITKSKWFIHLQEVRSENQDLSLKDCMKKAKKTYIK